MLDYMNFIVLPYVEKVREDVGEDKAALIVMDNFKGHVTHSMMKCLEENNMQVCTLPPNTTDRLQPLDISVNKPVKNYLKSQFNEWYSQQVIRQLDGKELDDLEEAELTPIDLSMPVMKEASAKWFVDAAEYISDNPSLIVSGFIHSGITSAFDGNLQDIEDDDIPGDLISDTDSESDNDTE